VTTYQLSWSPTAHARRLATVGLLALAPAVALGKPLLAVLGAPFVALLALGLSRPVPPAVAAFAELDRDRCVEGEDVSIRLRLDAGVRVDQLRAAFVVPSTVDFGPGQQAVVTQAWVSGMDLTVTIQARQWGRVTIGPVRVRLRTGGSSREAEFVVPVGQLAVYPEPSAAKTVLAGQRMRNRTGDHPSRIMGEGIEFAGVVEYHAGDSQRRINWSATSRRGRLFVTKFATERAVDLVLLLDALSDVGPRTRSSLDASIRGALGLAQNYLAHHDRVGIVALGGILRWLAPDVGVRQHYKIAEQVLSVRLDASYVDPDLARVPRSAMPPGALVVYFSPLLDDRAIEAARDIRERGHPLLVVDVLGTEPTPTPGSRDGALALRLWRLDRIALHHGLRAAGIQVVAWDGSVPLDAALRPMARVPMLARSS
jgi:uncharacterized protein (DUF58 family)